jgi:hypothetical protein
MPTLPAEFTKVILIFESVFSKRVWRHAQVLIAGALLAVGQRTVGAVLRVMGLGQLRQFQRFHRVLNRANWSALAASRVLLGALLRAFVPAGPVVVGLDDTIERRWGPRIAARGIYRDPVRSSRGHFVKASGLRWLSLMLLAPIPWAGRVWALPLLTALCPSERYDQQRGRPHKKLTDWARQMLLLLKRWLPGRQLIAVTDSSFAALELLGAVCRHVTMITRLRLDAALYAPAPPRQSGQRGRPRRKGQRLPSLKKVLDDPKTVWQKLTVDWYGQGQRAVEIASSTAVWFHPGLPCVPVRWLLIRDPDGRQEPQALLCTDQAVAPQQILQWFMLRWQVEVTFEETRAHLGIQTQRQWSDKAIARTTPALLALYSLVALLCHDRLGSLPLPVRTAAWYVKVRPTFSDTLAWVRRWLWSHPYFSTSGSNPDMVEIPRGVLDRLTETLCYAA